MTRDSHSYSFIGDSFRALCRLLSVAVSGLILSTTATAQVIDFETTPSGATPTDDLALPTTSFYTFGALQISFGFDYDTDGVEEADAVFERTGLNVNEPPNGGFVGSSGTDTADPGFTGQLGQWFLRSPIGGSDFGWFVIRYSGGTVTAASGEIWDIDGTDAGATEQYTVRAYDTANNLLATQVSPLGVLSTPTAPLDGRPWVFSFNNLSAGIARIEVDFTGSKSQGIGLAFNNFYPTTAVPELASVKLVLLAAAAWFAACRRKNRGNDTLFIGQHILQLQGGVAMG